MNINSIDDVITTLEDIISTCKQNSDPSGYFAALYHKVTVQVKNDIAANQFEDGARMETLDIIFAKRYIDAWRDRQQGIKITESWQRCFDKSEQWWPVVFQHLLLGMNAHINLDLGIAAAEVMRGKDIEDLKNDFYRINQTLSSLVDDVKYCMSLIWPPLKFLAPDDAKFDQYLVDFSMSIARDGAWKFAQSLSAQPDDKRDFTIAARDIAVANNVNLVMSKNLWAKTLLGIVRLGEIGSTKRKIEDLCIERQQTMVSA